VIYLFKNIYKAVVSLARTGLSLFGPYTCFGYFYAK